jgi:hypothetical protein
MSNISTLKGTPAQLDRAFKHPSVQDTLHQCMRGLLYTVWCYQKKGRSFSKDGPFWWVALYVSRNPPGNGFPVFETPAELAPHHRDGSYATNLLATHLGRSAYYAWQRVPARSRSG